MTGPKAKLVIFHQLSPADIRKMLASSNDSPTGGGARDLRFNFSQFDSVFREILPNRRTRNLRRDTVKKPVEVPYGEVQFSTPDGLQRLEIEWLSPTDSRPSDGRVPTINRLPVPDQANPVLMFIQTDAGIVHLAYASSKELNKWQEELADAVSEALHAATGRRLASGYIDLTQTKRKYIHWA